MPPAKRATTKPQDPAPEVEPETVDEAAEQASEQAQHDAQAQARREGVELTEQQLDRIGDRAAERVFKFFEREGAFRQPDPPPPPAPAAEPEEPKVDGPPRKQTWAGKVLGGYDT